MTTIQTTPLVLGRKPELDRDVPTIVVELVSAGSRSWKRDDVEKREEYLALGVVEYWVINRFERNMTVFSRKRGKKFSEQIVAENVGYRCTLLPGFELDLRRVFAVADFWEADQ